MMRKLVPMTTMSKCVGFSFISLFLCVSDEKSRSILHNKRSKSVAKSQVKTQVSQGADQLSFQHDIEMSPIPLHCHKKGAEFNTPTPPHWESTDGRDTIKPTFVIGRSSTKVPVIVQSKSAIFRKHENQIYCKKGRIKKVLFFSWIAP